MTHPDTDVNPNDQPRLASPGCCSAYVLPPLVVLMIAVGALMLAFRMPGRAASTSAAPVSALSAEALSRIFTPEVQHWATAIGRWSAVAGLDSNLAATVMQIESCGDPRALSRAGAIGLFQVMPYHFAAGEAPFAPEVNARRGLDYLARSLAAAQGDASLAFAGYNGGIGVIDRPQSYWPAETVRYAYWASGIYADAGSGMDASPRLEEWLRAGGASLCRSASQQLGLTQ